MSLCPAPPLSPLFIHPPTNTKQVRVLHDIDCVQVDYPEDGSGQVELTFQGKETHTFTRRFDWVVGADGVKSAVRGACEARTPGKVRAVKLPERNEFVYKTLPLDLRPRCVVERFMCVVCVFGEGGGGPFISFHSFMHETAI